MTTRRYQHGAAGLWWQVVTITAGSKRQSLLMAGDDDEMFMTRSLNVTPKTTEQHLIVRSHKSVACVTYNKRLRSTFYTIEANYWQTRSIARPLCDSRATSTWCSSRGKDFMLGVACSVTAFHLLSVKMYTSVAACLSCNWYYTLLVRKNWTLFQWNHRMHCRFMQFLWRSVSGCIFQGNAVTNYRWSRKFNYVFVGR